MREINGKPIRSRRGGAKHSAGNADRAADKPVSAQDQSSIAMASEGCTHRDGNSYSPAFYECSEGVPEDVYPRKSALGHGPRESLTKRQHLQMFTQKVEFEQLADVKRTQEYVTRDKWRGHIIGRTSTTTTDPNFRIAWKSDRTLLRRGKPDDWGGDRGTYYSRITSHSKRRQDMREFKHNPENDVQLNGQVPPGTNEDLDDHMGDKDK